VRDGHGHKATSVDGVRFDFGYAIDELDLRPGGYVSIGGTLGQVHTLEATAGGDAAVRGRGVLLEDGARPFSEVALEKADDEAVGAWLERSRPRRATLDVAGLVLHPSVRFALDAGGFDRHTFFCGQSGSGKTYALGTVLERLLLDTSLRIVILDPNSDFVRLREVRADVDERLAARYREAVAGLVVRRGEPGADRLHVRFTDFEAEEQAAVLRLDPIRDRDEYGVLLDLLDSGLETGTLSAQDLTKQLL
jgi:uncharacterized protein